MEGTQIKEKIPVFLSVGAPHNNIQEEYLTNLTSYLETQNIKAETLGRSFYSNECPLIPIQKKMNDVFGTVILAMERFHSKEGIYQRNSNTQRKVNKQYFSTVWTHIEGAMASQLGLPLLILKEDILLSEGMLDPKIHQWMVIPINPDNPMEILKNPIKGIINSWIEDVNEYYKKNVESL